MTSSTAPGHPYQVVAADLAAKIERGELRPGDKLPSVRTLAKDYGVTSMTAQKAVHQLTADGFAKTVPGLGAFVIDSEAGPAEDDIDIAERISRLAAAFEQFDQRLSALESAVYLDHSAAAPVDRADESGR
jgi:GntR family transcriptional regulator